MKNKFNLLTRFSTKFANAVFILGLLLSVFVVILYVYRLLYPSGGPYPDYMMGSVYKYYFKIIFISGIFVMLFGLCLKITNSLKVYLSVFFVTAGISVYGFETYLTFYRDNYNIYFGENRFIDRSYYGGTYAKKKNDNNYTKFSASGLDFIVINLDWKSDTSELKWAENLLQTYRGHRAIVVSHYILGGDFSNQEDNDSFYLQGQNIYNALKDNPSLFLMLSAHITPNGENMRTDIYNKGSHTYYDYNDNYRIYSLLANYQHRRPYGGNGWLRILQFSPTKNEIQVKTYSPMLDKWEEDKDSEFTLFYNMSDSVLTSIEKQTTNSSVAREDFAIIVIPDTQNYSDSFPDIFNIQTQWIVDNRDTWNIVYVAHAGDIVQNNSYISQWRNANRAMTILEDAVSEQFPDGIPYGMVPGNHDLLLSGKTKKEIFQVYRKKIITLYHLRNAIGLTHTFDLLKKI